jgi:hypothetical protein
MGLAVWQHGVLLFSIVCHCVVLWRLWSLKLARLYPYLTIFLGAETLQNIAMLPIRPRSTLYGGIWLLSTPLLWILAFLVVLELYRLILEDYPGIASVGRKAVAWCLGLAVAIAFFWAIPDLQTTAGQFPVLRIYLIAERSIVLSILLFLVLIQLFLFRYRLRLSSNRMVYAIGYALYFSVGVAQDIIFTALGIRVIDTVTLWSNVAAGLILLLGAALLTSRGEARVPPGPADSDSDRARLQQQLADINRLLSKAARGRD